MEQNFLIDTNVLIDNFGNKLPDRGKEFVNGLALIISTVTKIEILGWLGATEEQLQPLQAFIQSAEVLPINDAIVERTIIIRQSKKIALGDAIIAATALVYNLSLLTQNSADLKYSRLTSY